MNRQPMHTIHLHGSLARFGESYRLAVNTPREAIRALAMQIEGFGDAIKSGMFRLVRGKDPDTGMHYEVPYDAEKNQYDVSMLFFSLGKDGEDFHIVPVIAGAGRGVGKIVVGAVLLVAAVVASVYSGPASSPLWAAFAKTAGAMGASLVLSGVSTMLQPSAKANYDGNEAADQRASFFLGGQVNQSHQGGPVVLAYGRCRVGSTVISAGLSAERL